MTLGQSHFIRRNSQQVLEVSSLERIKRADLTEARKLWKIREIQWILCANIEVAERWVLRITEASSLGSWPNLTAHQGKLLQSRTIEKESDESEFESRVLQT